MIQYINETQKNYFGLTQKKDFDLLKNEYVTGTFTTNNLILILHCVNSSLI